MSRGKLLVVQLLSCVQLFVTPWTAAHWASLTFTISPSLLRFMATGSVMLTNHLILCPTAHVCPQSFPASGHAFDQAVSMARHRLPCREGSLFQEALPDCLLWVSRLLGPPLPTRGWLPPALRTLCPLGLSPGSLSERVGCGGGEIEDRCH